MTDKNYIEKIKQMKFKDFAYPVITVSAFLIFAIIFILSVRFIFNSVNKVFGLTEEEYKIIRFDVNGFNKIKDRLGIQ